MEKQKISALQNIFGSRLDTLTHLLELEFRLNPKEVKEEKGSLA